MHSTPGRAAWASAGLMAAMALALAGCASGPPPFGSPERDGPDAHPPPDLASVPDAEPKLEVVRPGGPNKPYQVMGQDYVPMLQDAPFSERGLASWYGRKFHGNRTSSGERYDMYAMTAAHPTLPIPSYARIRNPANGREVVVRINDRGPFRAGRIVDLSYTAALKLDLLRGVAPVELERITSDDIRTGAWRREPAGDAPQSAMAPSAAHAAPPEPPPAAPTPVPDAAGARASTAPSRGFWVQLGAFREHAGAVGFQRRVAAEADWLTPLLTVFSDAELFRLQAGPYPSREEARSAAERVRGALALVPVIVERR